MSWQDKLRQVEPYVAGEQPKINNMIKLNTNETSISLNHLCFFENYNVYPCCIDV